MDPPRFREGSDGKRCATCEHFRGMVKKGENGWGRCAKYDRPMLAFELCDSWVAEKVRPPVNEKAKARALQPF